MGRVIVIGCGGYVMAPVIYAAKKCGCKTLIHEQNSILGLSNKIMLKYTDTCYFNTTTCFYH